MLGGCLLSGLITFALISVCGNALEERPPPELRAAVKVTPLEFQRGLLIALQAVAVPVSGVLGCSR